MERLWLSAALALVSCAFGTEDDTATATGRLIQVTAREIVVRLDRDQAVPPGRRIEIYENVPGVGDVTVRGYWTVSTVNGTEVRAQPSADAGTPQLGCRARILERGQESRTTGKGTQVVNVAALLGTKKAMPSATTPNTGPPLDELQRMAGREDGFPDSAERLIMDMACDPDLGRELTARVRADPRFQDAGDLRIDREVARRRALIIMQTIQMMVADGNRAKGPVR
jgi:hypothetical protein